MFMCQFMGTTIVILTLWNMKYTKVCSLFVLSASLIAGAKVIIGQLNANDSSLSFYIPRPPRPRQWPSASTTRACAPTVSSKDNTYLIVIAFGNIFVFQFHNFTIFSQLGILRSRWASNTISTIREGKREEKLRVDMWILWTVWVFIAVHRIWGRLEVWMPARRGRVLRE